MQRVINFLKEARAELGKVTWPTRKELMESTVLVIVSVIAMSIFIGAVDFVFNQLLQLFAKNI
ncbi:MAG: preprotein translocase subunit SecE [Deltaproteobacteria bacterium]|nr:preprotein translocase subunit SecE [Deltaproteobacteria bacterium]